jgi:ABC-type sugar transport system permease subunit
MLIFLLPALIVVASLLVYPLVLSIFTSFHDNSGAFIGIANYQRFIADPLSGNIIIHTFARGVFGVIPSFLVGLAAALLINRFVKGRTTLTILVVLPFVISAPVGLSMWKMLLDSRTGVPGALGLNIQNVLTDSNLVWPVLILINTWGSFQFYLLLLLAARRRIPEDLYEAASIDGANAWRRFTAVTMPGIAGASLAACTIHFIASFQEFNLIYILTGGGPVNQTQSLATFAYQSAFQYYDTSYATTLTTISLGLMLLALGVLGLVVLAFRRWRAASAARWGRLRLPEGSTIDELPSRIPTGLTTPGSAVPGARRRRARRLGRPILLGIGGAVLALYALMPMLFEVSQSFDTSPPGAQAVSLLPRSPSIDNYVNVLTNPDLWSNSNIALPPLALNLVNSLLVTAAVTAAVVLIGVFAGYALARLRLRFTGALTLFFLVLQLVPVIVVVFPLYDLLSRIGLLGGQGGLILATTALFLPMAVIFFQVFFAATGLESEEAAAIDGAGPLRTFVSVVLPNSKTVIGAVGSFVLINTWNEFLLATSLISDSRTRTLPPALYQYMSSRAFLGETPVGQQAVYLLIPVFLAAIILVATQKLLLSAYEGGGVKG